jgi:hypothetical protein
LLQQREQQVLRLDIRVIVADSQALRIGKCLLKLGRKLVKSHDGPR